MGSFFSPKQGSDRKKVDQGAKHRINVWNNWFFHVANFLKKE